MVKPPETGAESRERHRNALQAAGAKRPNQLDYEREWIEVILAYIRENPGKSWEQACTELGIDWQARIWL
jgi:hypothetical protein